MFCDQCGQPLNGEPGPAHAACSAAAAGTGPAPAAGIPTTSAAATVTAPPRASRLSWKGRPRSYPTVSGWIASGLFRNWRGVTISLVCAWFQIPFVVIMGTVGAILGGIAGAVSGTAFGPGIIDRLTVFTTWIFPLPLPGGIADLVPTAVWQIGGIIGALWGAVAGAINLGWLALYWPWAALYEANPAWTVELFIGQIITGLFVGTVYTLWSIGTETSRIKLHGARRPSRREEAWLRPILEDVAARMGLPGIPILRVTDSREVNAYVMTRTLVVHRGLLEHLGYDKQMVSGVIAHELGHWANGDGVSSLFLKGVGFPLYVMYEIADRLAKASKNRFRPLQWMLRILLWGVTTTVRRIVGPVMFSRFRAQEYRADQAAVAAGYSEGLRRALSSFSVSFDGGHDGWDEVMLRSHPSNELRMERLETPGHLPPLVASSGGATGSVSPPHTSRADSTVDKGW